MNTYGTDVNKEEIILSSLNEQVMMEWEKPYMEESIDILKPTGHVLEIGFGFGYSATKILKFNPKSYTVIECDPVVIEKAKLWREKYPDIKITIVEGVWQEKLHSLGIFDEIYFDDFPLGLHKDSSQREKAITMKRFNIFFDLCIKNHTNVGSKICWYINETKTIAELDCIASPFIQIDLKNIDIKIPNNCRYRNLRDQKCTIPLVIKIKEYSTEEMQQYMINKIKKIIT
jgi:hypothetical protein